MTPPVIGVDGPGPRQAPERCSHLCLRSSKTGDGQHACRAPYSPPAQLLFWDIVIPADAIAVPELSSREILELVEGAAWFSAVGGCSERQPCGGLLVKYLKRCGVTRSQFRWIDDWDDVGRIARNLDAGRASGYGMRGRKPVAKGSKGGARRFSEPALKDRPQGDEAT